MYTPVATYRVQLHQQFNLQALDSIADYLKKLGISTIYAAPVLQSVPGSTHGYDAVDPQKINPEIGSLDELVLLCARFRSMNIGWVQDIVPNHMAFHTSNKLLMDVLERGDQSPFYNYFDINWSHPTPELHGKLMLPVLGNEITGVINDGNLKIVLTHSGMALSYYDQHYPLSIPAVRFLLRLPSFKTFNDGNAPHPLSYVAKAKEMLLPEDWEAYKKSVCDAPDTDNSHLQPLKDAISEVNENTGLLLQVLEQNFYRLVPPQLTSAQINYRRFFTVNELICVSMELPEVFNHYHQLIAKLVKENCFQGLRVDHIDGLKDPLNYLKKLREMAGKDCYLLTEKILSGNEIVPDDWPQQGTTGYDFLRIMNRLFIKDEHLQKLKAFYFNLFPDQGSYEEQVAASKQLILEKYMKGELHNLTAQLMLLPGIESAEKTEMQAALGRVMLAMPCYRIYPQRFPMDQPNAAILRSAFERARESAAGDTAGLKKLEHLLLRSSFGKADNDKVLGFLQRMMQFTGPLTAKGVEDTVFYRYNVLLSHNEVGDHPSDETMTPAMFHQQMEDRLQRNPLALNGTATHDTKRGEDARMRINSLGFVFDKWKLCIENWTQKNNEYTTIVDGMRAPTTADEYFIYQSMVGGAMPDGHITAAWESRFCNFFIKGVREAKANTDWVQPNTAYEDACIAFIKKICRHPDFTTAFSQLIKTLDRYAHVFSLGQLVLKMTAPGVPDIYQGCERWDYSFVDPDNRRPVDYTAMQKSLADIMAKEQKGLDQLLTFLRQHENEGLPKLFVTHKTLQLRQAHDLLFSSGEYIPLTVAGPEKDVVAFARRMDNRWVLTIVPLQLPGQLAAGAAVLLPAGSPVVWQNIFTGKKLTTGERIAVHEVLNEFPVAVMESVNEDI